MAAPGCSAVSLGQQCPHLSVCPQHPYYVALLLLLVDSGLKEGVPVSNSPSRRKKKKMAKAQIEYMPALVAFLKSLK